jgi:SEC-C motif-containing protein
MARNDCPCGSGERYSTCCKPLHRGEREAIDAPALMRSRFSAFALGEVEYLWKTLAPEHEDRSRPKDEVLRSLKASASTFRYQRLAILETQPPDEHGIARVRFRAGVFHKGRDVSFEELSEFVHDGTGWRYLRATAP